MRQAADARHQIVLRDEHAYLAHPHVARAAGAILLICNWAPRRDFVLHPPEDPFYCNLLLRSADEGASWSAPAVAPGHGWSGVECAGLTDLGGGAVLLNQWRFAWHALPAARQLADLSDVAMPEQLVAAHLASAEHDGGPLTIAEAERLLPWARGPGTAWAHLSSDGGLTWARSIELDTRPFVGGYGMRGGVLLTDGTIVLPLADVPSYRQVFVLRSQDGGASWSRPTRAAALPDRWFEEPAPLLLRSGRILLLLRENRSKSLWRTWSDDGGCSWAMPVPTGIDGYPAHLCHLADDRILCTYGFRRDPFAIRAAISTDGGVTWPVDEMVEIRAGLPGKDLGYPCTLASAGGLLSVYYARDETGCTAIHATRWQFPDGD